jgi:hypothetical protein
VRFFAASRGILAAMRLDDASVSLSRRFKVLPQKSPYDILSPDPAPGKDERGTIPAGEGKDALAGAVRVHL